MIDETIREAVPADPPEDDPTEDQGAQTTSIPPQVSQNPSSDEGSLDEGAAPAVPTGDEAETSEAGQASEPEPAAIGDTETDVESSGKPGSEGSDDSQDEDNEADDEGGSIEPLELLEDSEDDVEMAWYILKVQVNREQSICDALKRRIKLEDLERHFTEILVPTEDVREFTKSGKQRVVKRKLYPGYIVVNMAINDETWFLVRETPGIGDFTGSAGKPTPMAPHEIERILRTTIPDESGDKEIKTTIRFKTGDRVRVKEGNFQNFEGEVHTVDETHGRVTVLIQIFGRPTEVELEHWQVEDV